MRNCAKKLGIWPPETWQNRSQIQLEGKREFFTCIASGGLFILSRKAWMDKFFGPAFGSVSMLLGILNATVGNNLEFP